MSAINAGLEGQSEERQRHVRVVIVGRSVVGAAAGSNVIRWSDAEYEPARHRRIAVQVLAAKLVGRDMKIGELRAREVIAHADLLQGFSGSLSASASLTFAAAKAFSSRKRTGQESLRSVRTSPDRIALTESRSACC